MPEKVYKSRTEFLIAKMGDDAFIDQEDHLIQLAWTPEQMPSNEELRKRQEIRKE